jgi:hypothetical protein
MARDSKETRECPYCREEVKAEAILCKHCGSRLTPERPSHGGTCPYCKESIHPEATKCKHCRSSLLPEGSRPHKDCGCDGDTVGSVAAALLGRVGAGSGFSPLPGEPAINTLSRCRADCQTSFWICYHSALAGHPDLVHSRHNLCYWHLAECLRGCERNIQV